MSSSVGKGGRDIPPLSIAAGSLNQTVEIYFCFYNVPTTEGGYYADKPHNSHSREVLSEKKKKKSGERRIQESVTVLSKVTCFSYFFLSSQLTV